MERIRGWQRAWAARDPRVVRFWVQTATLVSINFSQGVMLTTPFTLSVYMVRRFEQERLPLGEAVDEQRVGRLTGLLAGSFSMASFVTSMVWGIASNILGRKLVLTTGLAVSVISMIWYGLATTYAWAVVARAFGGFFNGVLGAWKCLIGESGDSLVQGKMFGFMSLAWGLGTTVGPIIGGSLAQPCDHIASMGLCQPGQLFYERPFFLACLVGSITIMFSFTATQLLLDETLPPATKQRTIAVWRARGHRLRGWLSRKPDPATTGLDQPWTPGSDVQLQPTTAPTKRDAKDASDTGVVVPHGGGVRKAQSEPCRDGDGGDGAETEGLPLLGRARAKGDSPACICRSISIELVVAGDGLVPVQATGKADCRPSSPGDLDTAADNALGEAPSIGGLQPQDPSARQGESTDGQLSDDQGTPGEGQDASTAGQQLTVAVQPEQDESAAELETRPLLRQSGPYHAPSTPGRTGTPHSPHRLARVGFAITPHIALHVDDKGDDRMSAHSRGQSGGALLSASQCDPGRDSDPHGDDDKPMRLSARHSLGPFGQPDASPASASAPLEPDSPGPLHAPTRPGSLLRSLSSMRMDSMRARMNNFMRMGSRVYFASPVAPFRRRGEEESQSLIAPGAAASHNSPSQPNPIIGTKATDSGCNEGSQEAQPKPAPNSPPSDLVVWYRNRQVLLTIGGYGFCSFLWCAVDELIPIFGAAPVETGGLGLEPAQLAPPITVFGICLMVYSAFIYPMQQRMVGTLRLSRLGLITAVLVCMMLPLAHSALATSRTLSNVLLYGAMVVKSVAQCAAFTGALVMVNAAPHQSQLGEVNGVGQTVAALVRGLGPALGGVLWAASLALHSSIQQFVPFVCVALLALASFFVYGYVHLPNLS